MTEQPKSRRSLVVTLTAAFIVVSGTGVLSIGLGAYVGARDALIDRTGALLQRQAEDVIDEIDRSLYERTLDLRALAWSRRARGDAESIRSLLDDFVTTHGVYDLVLIADVEGRVIGSNAVTHDGRSFDDASPVGAQIQDESWFRAALEQSRHAGNVHAGPAIRTRWVEATLGPGTVSLPFAVRVSDDEDRPLRIVVALASRDRLVGDVVRRRRDSLGAQGLHTVETQVLDARGFLLDDADPTAILSTFNLAEAGLDAARRGISGLRGHLIERHKRRGVDTINGYAGSTNVLDGAQRGWSVLVRQDVHEAYAALASIRTPIASGVSTTILLIGLIARHVSGRIVAPLDRVSRAANALAEGDLDVRVEVRRRDEIGRLAESVRGTVGRLRTVIEHVQSTVHEVSRTSAFVKAESDRLASRSVHTAYSIKGITQATEQVSNQVDRNAERARSATELASRASQTASTGDEQMRSLIGAMREIDESSRAISGLIESSDAIATKTNLLALNASVEAARAGPHGRGFAVVAQEVRSLAEQSARAARETTELIANTNASVGHGMAVADGTARALAQIVDSVAEAEKLVTEIAQATSEQARSLEEINEGLGQIDRCVREDSGSAAELARAADELAAESASAEQSLSHFRSRASPRADGHEDVAPVQILRALPPDRESAAGAA